jgi:hypothetical protein
VTRCKTKWKAEILPKENLAGSTAKLYLWQNSTKDGFGCQRFRTRYECHEFPRANCQRWFWLPEIFFGSVAANF